MTRRSVTVVTQYFRPERGAAQVRLGSIVDQLVDLDWDVRVVTSLPNYPTGRIFPGWGRRPVRVDRERGAAVTRVWVYAAMGGGAARMANYASFAVMSLLGLLRTGTTDWYLVEYPTLIGAIPAVIWARCRRRKVVVIVADLWVDTLVELGTIGDGAVARLLRRLELWTFRRCDSVTAVTEGVRERLVDKGVAPEQISWLPNGVDTDLFRPGDPPPDLRSRYGVPEQADIVLYAGTHGYVHGLEVVLDAAEQLRGRPVVFLLVGGGSEKDRLVDEARARGLDNVVFHDPVAPEDVADLLRSSVVGLATVRAGDLYRTIRSAKMFPTMATGLPVIYSGDDEGSRLVRDAGAGLITEPGDGIALAHAVELVLDDPALASELGRAGRSWVCENAGWDRLVGRWLGDLAGNGAVLPPPSIGPKASVDGHGGRR